jgi:ParB-like chromosome segregation protein Spo0J
MTDDALLSIEELLALERFQVRTCENRATITHYAARILAGDVFPPILVAQLPDRKVLIDGHHRLAAYAMAKSTNIRIRYVTLCESDLLESAISANSAHGLPLSRAERRSFASRLLAAAPGKSNREIAKMTGVDEKTIRRLRLAPATRHEKLPAKLTDANSKLAPSFSERLETISKLVSSTVELFPEKKHELKCHLLHTIVTSLR